MSISPTVLVFPFSPWFLARLLGGRSAQVKEGSTTGVVLAECRGLSRDVMLMGGLGAVLTLPRSASVRQTEAYSLHLPSDPHLHS